MIPLLIIFIFHVNDYNTFFRKGYSLRIFVRFGNEFLFILNFDNAILITEGKNMNNLNTITRRFDPADGFRLELHLHTRNSSACASLDAADAVLMYQKAGYGGLVVTDHFLTGNARVDKTLPWETQVDLFFNGVDEAVKKGKEVGFTVFEGLEYTDWGTDFLVYGLSRDFIKAHPEMTKMTPEQFLPFFHDQGAFIIQAHPFRQASYVREVRSYIDYVDAFEVINLGNKDPEFNRLAYEEAKRKGKRMTAGSDCHGFGDEYFGAGILLDHKPSSLAEVCNIIRSGNYSYFGG